MRIATKRLRLESLGFRYKVALYLSYLRVKFDDKIKEQTTDNTLWKQIATVGFKQKEN